jgi:hypothetical protein
MLVVTLRGQISVLLTTLTHMHRTPLELRHRFYQAARNLVPNLSPGIRRDEEE